MFSPCLFSFTTHKRRSGGDQVRWLLIWQYNLKGALFFSPPRTARVKGRLYWNVLLTFNMMISIMDRLHCKIHRMLEALDIINNEQKWHWETQNASKKRAQEWVREKYADMKKRLSPGTLEFYSFTKDGSNKSLFPRFAKNHNKSLRQHTRNQPEIEKTALGRQH